MRFICIGAHPDDCEIEFGGTAALLAEGGHAVKFLSVTNGDAGHMRSRGEELARTRLAEAREAACRARSTVSPRAGGKRSSDIWTTWKR